MPPSVSLTRTVGQGATQLQAAISTAANLSELIELVPAPFRARMRVLINRVYAAAKKSNHARSYLATLQKHKVDGSFPPEIGGRIDKPALQISKEYTGSGQWKLHEQKIDTSTRDHKVSMLDTAISVKQDEVAYLQSLFSETTYIAEVDNIYQDIVTDLAADSAVDIRAEDGSINVEVLPPWCQMECQVMSKHGKTFPGRAIALAHSANQQEMSKKFKSLALKAKSDGDVEMLDPEDRNSSIQAIVQKELAKALKANKMSQPNSKGKNKKKTTPKPRKASTPPSSGVSKSRSPKGKGNRGRSKSSSSSNK